MLNAIEPSSYVRPHRHLDPAKIEVFLCLQGLGAAVIFDERGSVSDVCPLAPFLGQWGVDVPVGTFHTILSFESNSVFYEIKPGPFIPIKDSDFAPWAPAENTPEAKVYLEELVLLAKGHLGWLER